DTLRRTVAVARNETVLFGSRWRRSTERRCSGSVRRRRYATGLCAQAGRPNKRYPRTRSSYRPLRGPVDIVVDLGRSIGRKRLELVVWYVTHELGSDFP